MRFRIATISVIVFAGCSANSPRPPESSIGQQISDNLLNVNEMYCGGSHEAKERLSKLKQESGPFHVVDRKTGAASNVWVVLRPVVEPARVKWGISLAEPVSGVGCGVAYLKPEQLEELKVGYMP